MPFLKSVNSRSVKKGMVAALAGFCVLVGIERAFQNSSLDPHIQNELNEENSYFAWLICKTLSDLAKIGVTVGASIAGARLFENVCIPCGRNYEQMVDDKKDISSAGLNVQGKSNYGAVATSFSWICCNN